ncbi:MAG: hypothetical protein ABR507_02635 [Actinomycetota bacterium]|nr:hypothetical protein [Actinomycetota bacterium]
MDECQGILMALLDGISDSADVAYRHGEAILMRAGPEAGAVAKTVRLLVETPFFLEDEVVILISWEATGATALFPKMDAELRLAPVSPSISKLGIEGSYEPPLGTIGRVINRALLHRVAEATIKHFIDRLGEALLWPPETNSLRRKKLSSLT